MHTLYIRHSIASSWRGSPLNVPVKFYNNVMYFDFMIFNSYIVQYFWGKTKNDNILQKICSCFCLVIRVVMSKGRNLTIFGDKLEPNPRMRLTFSCINRWGGSQQLSIQIRTIRVINCVQYEVSAVAQRRCCPPLCSCCWQCHSVCVSVLHTPRLTVCLLTGVSVLTHWSCTMSPRPGRGAGQAAQWDNRCLKIFE